MGVDEVLTVCWERAEVVLGAAFVVALVSIMGGLAGRRAAGRRCASVHSGE